MFADLHSKVVKVSSMKESSDARSLQAPITSNSRTNSNESLISLGSVAGSVYRKCDRIRHLESKVAEFGALIRQKNAAIESSKLEIDKLTAELAGVRNESSQISNLLTDRHKQEMATVEKGRQLLSVQLKRAEEDLDSVNRLSDELSHQNNEMRKRAQEEVETLKRLLTESEETIRALRTELTKKAIEDDRLALEMAQLREELRARDEAIHTSKNMRSKMQCDQSAQEETIRRLRNENEEESLKNGELKKIIEQLKAALIHQERLVVEESDRVVAALAETERLRTRLSSTEVRAADRESDLKDRVRMLEERIVLLTDPSSELFATQIEEASKQMPDEEVGTNNLTNADTPEGTASEATRVITLLVERKLLENRLKDTRKHLEEVKTSWNEKNSILEAQIAHLNAKITEDNAEFTAAQSEWESCRQKYEDDLFSVRQQWSAAKEKILQLETLLASKEHFVTESLHDWEVEKSSFVAKISALQTKAEEDLLMHTKTLSVVDELKSAVSASDRQLAECRSNLNEKENELDATKRKLGAQEDRMGELKSQCDSLKQLADDKNTKAQQISEELASVLLVKEELMQRIQAAEEIRNADIAANTSQINKLNAEIDCLMKESQETRQRLSSAESTAAEITTKCELLVVENKKLALEAEETEARRLTEADARESAEVALLTETIESLKEMIGERNKTIRLQKQKLTEFKRALGQGLQGLRSVGSNTTLVDGDGTAGFANDNGFSNSLVPVATTPVVTATCINPLTISVAGLDHEPRKEIAVNEASLVVTSEKAPCTPPIQPIVSAPSARLPVTSMESSRKFAFSPNATHDMDWVNFDYLRHVVLKFLLSPSSEALKLVRAVSTLLRFSKEDEFLVRQNLESRNSWFVSPIVSPKNSGQFAKVISPPI